MAPGDGNEGIDNAASFTEDAGPTTLAPGALVIDVDNTNLTSAQIQLTNDPDDAAESLAVDRLRSRHHRHGLQQHRPASWGSPVRPRWPTTRPACGS